MVYKSLNRFNITTAATIFLYSCVSPMTAFAGASHYVDNRPSSSCSDAGPGSMAVPWCSFANVNAPTFGFGPGDGLYLARGAVWNQPRRMRRSSSLGFTRTPRCALKLANPGCTAMPHIASDLRTSRVARRNGCNPSVSDPTDRAAHRGFYPAVTAYPTSRLLCPDIDYLSGDSSRARQTAP